MRPNLYPLIAAVALPVMIAACASSPPISTAAPPRLQMPVMALTPCALHRLPEGPTLGDLEAGYMTRGAQIIACDAARDAAVQTLLRERAMIDVWIEGGKALDPADSAER